MAKEITKAQREAVARYEAKAYDKTLIRLPKGQLDDVRAAAQASGQSLNGYIAAAIDSALQGSIVGRNSTLPDVVSADPLQADSVFMPELIRKAEEAAKAAGEPLADFLSRAIDTTAQRDRLGAMLKKQIK